jgi:tetraacyldisaccharide 4'-kinase
VADSHWLWESPSVVARGARLALLPGAAVFRVAATVRNWMFDAGVLPTHPLGAPAVSVGNLTVGGTGKTPFASWLAVELAARGGHPGILLRGYGGDEAQLHARLAPHSIVVADADRLRGAEVAIARGSDVLVLDDAFQHRRARRDADIVLISADAARCAPWPVPAGPWREPMRALRRARLVVITCKAATAEEVAHALAAVSAAAPGVPTAVARLSASEITTWDGAESRPVDSLRGQRALAISGIGDPAAFETQLRAAGVHATPVRYPDHYAYTAAEAANLVRRAGSADFVICTLKDAVKLGPVWPHGAAPLWYLRQRVAIERGAESLAALVAELLAARDHVPHARFP